VPLVLLLERSWLIFKWFLPLKIQINSKKTRFWKEKSLKDVVKLGPTAQATLVYKNKQTWQPGTHVRTWLILISHLLYLLQPSTLTYPKSWTCMELMYAKCKGHMLGSRDHCNIPKYQQNQIDHRIISSANIGHSVQKLLNSNIYYNRYYSKKKIIWVNRYKMGFIDFPQVTTIACLVILWLAIQK
jgi:hypothetical protein